ncbi:MAG: heme ABC exporter ATP-binding protein CcmA [Thermoplasmata archaeon]
MVSLTPPVAGSEASPGTPSISCRAVCAGYLGSEVLKDISFEITAPSVYVVLGPNGAGKTTLFRTLAGILSPSWGNVVIGRVPGDGQTARDRMHYLSHLDGLPEGFTVREALDFYARAELATGVDIDRVLDKLQIRDLSARYLGQLSSGQKKRVSIARVFLRERDIYLLDEPTANLDPKVAKEIRSLILELSRDKVVLYSSHNLYEAREIGRYVIVIKEGRLALFDRIENLRASKFRLGVRLLNPSESLEGWTMEGEYFVRELGGPEDVQGILHDLDARGVRLRETREMDNPLEDIFD